ncbi:putative sugar nucleotidyl transferase [Hufsiella ginkgonis]|uniref:Glucose-1-phosphate thymidylyltransferase n=1 Tax=Hufsiella ginkgonis TaxID=2695274 RepID=A0A7K1XYA2_9SPHI|nr:putative sugar nucleotidyl transferase [Hufsiella ginkgonis]MXV15960.1 glucose-1-phosphate thymidylyltransferase [Hufsiella ginkgonis]
MKITLFDDSSRQTLLPLTFTRPVAGIRIGILTIAGKWQKWLGAEVAFHTEDYLQELFPPHTDRSSLFINGSVCPDEPLLNAISALNTGDALMAGDLLIAVATGNADFEGTAASDFKPVPYTGSFTRLVYPEDIFKNNDTELRKDFALLTTGRSSASLSATNTIIGDHLFAEEGAEAECATFNTLKGPVYLGRNSAVWEGSNIKGSFALCDNSQVKMGTKIYPMTTIGPYCRVGGEINNAVIFAHSSKGHEGYLGNSVLGEWCNIGADSNNSNLKNNYAEVRLWDYSRDDYRKTGLQFCGLIMGDHTKCGINTMFNTGTVAGVCANVFGAGFPKNFIPDFSWGGSAGIETYRLEKLFDTVERVFERRDIKLDAATRRMLTAIFEKTEKYRSF